MRLVALSAALVGVPLLAVAAHSVVRHQEAHASSPVPYSQDALVQLRDALTAQIAAYDAAEQAMRDPTAAQASALAVPPVIASRIVPLPQGGVALGLEASQLSWAVATIGDDGQVHVTHDEAPIDAVADAGTGGHDAR